MSLKSKKHILFVLTILLMLILIPVSFAEEIDDASEPVISSDSTGDIIQAPVDDVNTTVGSDDTDDDVLTADVIYVGPDGVGTDASGYGTEDNPYATISYAYDRASSGSEIIVMNGTHTVSTAIKINKNIKITGQGNSTITNSMNLLFDASSSDGYTIELSNLTFKNLDYSTSMKATFFNSVGKTGTLNINDCNFINIEGNHLMYTTYTVTIKRCNFIKIKLSGTSSSSGGAILADYNAATFNIAYSNFIDNQIWHVFSDWSNSGESFTLNNNYWGTNAKPSDSYVTNDASNLNFNTWVKLEGAADGTVYAGSTGNVQVKFVDDSGNDLTANMAKLPIELVSANGAQLTPASTDIVNNEATVAYSAENSGVDTLSVKYGSIELTSFTVNVEDNPEGTLFVDAATGSDESGDGSPSNKYATIKKALDNLGNNSKIIVSAGEYTLDNYQLASDVEIIGKTGAVVKAGTSGKHLTIASGANVNLTNLEFTDATACSIESAGNLIVTQCLFEDNAGTNVIKSTGTLNVAYSAFVNNDISGNIIDASSGTAEYNFWGSNDKPTGFDVTNYVIIIPSFEDEVYVGGSYDLTLTLTDNNGYELDTNLPTFDASVSTVNGTLSPTTVEIANNIGTSTYTTSKVGEDEIEIKVGSNLIKKYEFTVEEDDTSRTYVDAVRGDDTKGTGSKAKPYKTIQKAVSATSSGGEIAVADGVYEISSSISLAKNIKIVATGDNAILKSSGNNIFSAGTTYTNELVGLTFTGVTGTNWVISGSTTSTYSPGTLNVINCTFIDNAGTYGVIKSYLTTNIMGCTFINNTAKYSSSSTGFRGLITFDTQSQGYSSYNTITDNVNYNLFINNTVINQGLYIENARTSYVTVNIDNNYWDGEALDSSKYTATGVTCTNYLVLEVSEVTGDVYVGIPMELTAEFKTNDGSALSGDLVNKHITFTTSCGDVSPATTVISNNKITTTYTATSAGSENVVVNINGVELTKWTFNTVELPAGTILVDINKGHDDATADGSALKPYKTIAYALNHLGSNNAVMVQAGEYELTDYQLSDDVTITGIGEVVITSTNDYHLDISGAEVTLNNLIFKGAYESSIYSDSDVTITKCIFTENHATYVIDTIGEVDISYTIFANNNVWISILQARDGTVNNNFWGTNNPDSDDVGLPFTNWVVINATMPIMVDNSVPSETNHDLNIEFVLNNGSSLDEAMPDFDVELSADVGTVTDSVTISDNIATAVYRCEAQDVEDTIEISAAGNVVQTLTFNVTEREEGRIYVNGAVNETGNGTKAKPFKTIEEAVVKNLELGGGNEIVIYDGIYVLTKIPQSNLKADFNMTGRGDVVIDLTQSKYFLYLYLSSSDAKNYDIALNNLNFINQGESALISYTGTSYKDKGTLIIDNCTFADGKGRALVETSYVNVKMTNSAVVDYDLTSNIVLLSNANTDINYCIFMNVTSSNTRISASGGNLDYNFWGSNDKPSVSYAMTLNNWVVADMSINSSAVQTGASYDITVKFLSTADGKNFAELNESLPEATFELTSLLGNAFSSDEIIVSYNIGTVVYTPTINGDEVINLTAGKTIDDLTLFVEEGDRDDLIFVNESYTGSDSDGSKAKPFTNLKDALDENHARGGGNTISVIEGTYEISNYAISDDVLIRWSKKDVTIKANNLVINSDNVTFENIIFKDGNAITVNENADLIIVNSTFLNNNGIVSSEGNLEIVNSKFINNTAISGKGLISATGGSIDIAYSEFVANNVGSDKIVYSTISGDVNDNYWGSNDAPNVSEVIAPASWVALVIEMEDESINASEVQSLTLAFKNTTDGTTFTDLDVSMPSLDVGIAPTIGAIDKTNVTIEDNVAVATYTATTEGDEVINFTVDDIKFDELDFNVGRSVEGMVFVATWGSDTTGDGSRLRPYATVEKGVSSAAAGKEVVIFEGTYAVTSTINVYKDVTISGWGEVIITSAITPGSYTSQSIFSDGSYKLTVNNITFANITSAGTSYAYYNTVIYVAGSSYDYSYLTLNDCTFVNNTAGNAIIGTANSNPYSDVKINNCVFENNTVSGGSNSIIEVRRQSLTIQYSEFIDNHATNIVYPMSTSYVTMDLNNNFWGDNENIVITYQAPANWVVVDAAMNSTAIESSHVYELIISFNSTADGSSLSELAGTMPDMTVSLSSTLNDIDATATISGNSVIVTYNAAKYGDEKIIVALNDNELAVLEFVVDEYDDGSKIFVNASYTGESDGSKAKPYTNLADALNRNHELGGGKTISVQEGNYEINNYAIADDVYIIGSKGAIIEATDLTVNANNVTFENLIFEDGNKITVNADKNLTIIGSVFEDMGGVIESNGNLVVITSQFINDNPIDGKGVINALGGTIDISYSEFIGCDDGSVIVYSDVDGTVNNNFWNNEEPNVSDKLAYTNWVEIVASHDDVIYADEEYVISFAFASTDGENYTTLDKAMPTLEIELEPTIGQVDPAVISIVKNSGETSYVSNVYNDESIVIISNAVYIGSVDFEVVEDETGKLFVSNDGSDTDGDGSKANPYATITKALSQATAGTEIVVLGGSYSTSSYYNINKDNIKLTGRDNPTLTTTSSSYLFYFAPSYSTYTFTLSGFTIENCSSNYVIYTKGSSTYYYLYLNIDNCEFKDNTATGYSIIYAYYSSLNVTNCNFTNNVATAGSTGAIIYCYGPGKYFDVEQNNFIDNSAKYVVYATSLSAASVANNVNYNNFVDNTASTKLLYVLSSTNRDYNYFGTNTPSNVCNQAINNWVVLDIDFDTSIYQYESSELNAIFKYTTDGTTYSELPGVMPTITFDVSAEIGEIDSEITMIENVGTVFYTATNIGEETIAIECGDIELGSVTFDIDVNPEGKIFVSPDGDDTTGNGTIDAPYATIAKAIEENHNKGGNWTVYIRPGDYELTNAEISDNIIIEAEDGVTIDGKGANVLEINNNATVALINVNIINGKNSIKSEENTELIIIDSVFAGNDGAIISKGDTEIYRTLFDDNDGTVVKASAGSLSISYSSFTNNNGTLVDSSVGGTVDYNFWGTNALPTNINGVTPANWVIATLSAGEIYALADNEITVEFTLNDGSELEDTLPDTIIDAEAVNGTVDVNIVVSDNVGFANYRIDDETTDTITISSNGVELDSLDITAAEYEGDKIFVSDSLGDDDTGDGSKANPYKTITKALTQVTDTRNKVIVLGGSYVASSYYTINKKVAIIARGDVYLTKTGSGYLFYMSGNSALNLTGVTIENLTGSSYGTVVYGYGSSSSRITVNVDNCTIRNNNAKSSNIFYVNYGDLTVTNSTIVDNAATGTYRLFYVYYGDLTVLNNNIINNHMGTQLVYVGSGKETINYNNFVNNTVTGSYLLSGYSISGGNINYNFWGTNTKPTFGTTSSFDNWVVLNADIDSETICVGEDYNINLKFQYTTDGTTFNDLDQAMPEISFDLTSDLGNAFGDSTVTMVNNEATTTFTATNAGNETISISYGNTITELTFMVSVPANWYYITSIDMIDLNGAVISTPWNTFPYTFVEDGFGNALPNGQAITIQFNDTIVNTNVNDNMGTFEVDMSSIRPGTYTVTFSADGYTSAVATVTVGKIPTEIVCTSDSITLAYGEKLETGEYGDWDAVIMSDGATVWATVDITVADPTVVYYNDDFYYSYFEGLKVGTTTVNISYAGDNEYEPSYKIVTIEVIPADASVSVENDTLDLFVYDNYNIVETTTPEGINVTYVSSDESVAIVGADGKVTAIGEGSATITVTINDANYVANTTDVTVTVSKKPTEIVCTSDSITLAYGEKLETGEYGDWDAVIMSDGATVWATVDITVADPTVVYYNDDFYYSYFEGLKVGTTTVNISYAGDDEYASSYKIVTIEVIPADASVSVENDTLDMIPGENSTIVVTTTPEDLNVTYVSSDESVVTVDADGKVTAIADGSAVITVTINDDNYVANTTEISVTVTTPYAGVIYVSKDGSDDNDGSEDKPVATIAKAIELATSEGNTAHKIIIREGTYEESGLEIASDLEIVGEDAVIDALNEGRILDITGGNVNISGITFANANVTGYGGAISIKDATVEIDECVFENNTATSGAGAILWNADNGKLSNSVFENNAGRNGAAVMIGTISFNPKGDNTEITNCVFNNNDNLYNAAGCVGLAVYADSVKVTDSNFTNNHGKENSNHGALYIYGEDAEVSGCLFENNSMDGAAALQADGDYVNIHDNVFRNNTITGGIASRGGAIELQSPNAEIKNNVFENNGGEDCYYGGAINIVYVDYDGEIVISENNFINNSAFVGGAIYIDGGYSDLWNEFTISIENNTFEGNEAGYGAGIFTENTGDTVVTISSNEFKDQMANYGGAIYSEDSIIELSENTMENCIALVDGKDIYVYEGEISSEVNLIISEDATIYIGENVTITAILTDDNGNTISGGLIKLTANGDKIAELDVVNGTVSVVFTPSKAENYTISGSYDLADDVTVETALIEVIKKDANITAESNGTHIIISLPEDATGNVSVAVGNGIYPAEIKDGKAIVEIPELAPGDYTAVIKYDGDDNYANDTTSVELSIRENATYSIDAPEVTEGENVTVTVTLPEDATGDVTIGNEVVPVVNGTASAVLTNLPVGNTTVPITYSGDDKYNPIETSVTVTVDEKPAFIIDAPDVVKYYHGSERFVVTITDGDGKPIANESVDIILNGVTYTKTTDANGTASLGLNLNSGNYSVSVVFNNTTVNATVTILSTVEGNDLVKVFRNATPYTATFKDSEGNFLAKGTLVEYNINGVMYKKEVGENGVAKLNINLAQGTYIITAINPVTGEKCANNITVLPRIVENNDIVKYYKNGTQYTVKLIGDDGNPVGAGEVVTFNINGVFYNRTTDENGVAQLNINLQPGDYIITAEYKTCKVSNNITVLPVLSANNLTKQQGGPEQFVATLVDGQGNPYEGQTVTFNINGVFYNKTTDSNGQAKLNINLQAGEYIITSSYNGTNVANKVTVTPKQ